MKIAAVVPVYNEEEVIDEFIDRLVSSLEKTSSDYEVVLVVEGDDGTMNKLKEICQGNPNVRVDYHKKRMGLGKALKRGMYLVSNDANYVVTMDADLNHQPEEIGTLLAASGEAEVIVGSRSRSHGMVDQLPFFKRVVSGATNWILRKSFGIPSSDVTSGFRLYSADAVRVLRDDLRSTNFEVTPELLIRAKKRGFKITEVPITFIRRPRGNSKLSFVKSGIGYAKLLVRFRQ